jgi:hypothetical protein
MVRCLAPVNGVRKSGSYWIGFARKESHNSNIGIWSLGRADASLPFPHLQPGKWSLQITAMSHGPFEVFAHERTFREHAGQQERENYREPAADRKAGTERLRKLPSVHAIPRSRNSDSARV